MKGSIVANRRRKAVLALMSLALLVALLLPLAAPAAAAPSQSYGAPPYAQALSNVNIRSGPGTGFPVIGVVYAGQIVQVLSVGQGGWYQIACQSNGYVTCWITGSPNYVRPLYSLPGYPGCPGYPPSSRRRRHRHLLRRRPHPLAHPVAHLPPAT